MNKWLETSGRVMMQDLTKGENDIFYCPSDLYELLKWMTNFNWVVDEDKFKEIPPVEVATPDFNQSDINTYEKVVLLSGGLDSLGGVAYLKNKNELDKTLFITYVTRTGDKVNAERAFDIISKSNNNVRHLIFSKKIHAIEDKVKSNQRTRSFWFLSFAKAAADAFNIPKIYLFENGVVSLNPQVTIDRSLTKTTHPKTIDLMSKYFGNDIITPFKFHTKGEVVKQILRDNDLKDLIKYSNTCSKTSIYRNTYMKLPKEWSKLKNCGKCYSCIVRRMAEQINKFEGTEYALDHSDAEPTIQMKLDDLSLKRYFRTLSDKIGSGTIKWYLPKGKDGKNYFKMYKRFVIETEEFKW